MPKHGALIAFGLVQRREERATMAFREPSLAEQGSYEDGIGQKVTTRGEGEMDVGRSNWSRRSASAAVMGGWLLAGQAAVTTFVAGPRPLLDLLGSLAAVLLAVGVVGLYRHANRSKRFGRLGRTGADLSAAAFGLAAVGGVVGAVVGVEVARPVGLLVAVGSVLFGGSVLRARTLSPGGAALTLMVASVYVGAAVVLILGAGTGWLLPATEALVGLGWAWMGVGLLSSQAKGADYLGSPASG
jgi:hypothetical protein